jgi:hypothetical protein
MISAFVLCNASHSVQATDMVSLMATLLHLGKKESEVALGLVVEVSAAVSHLA